MLFIIINWFYEIFKDGQILVSFFHWTEIYQQTLRGSEKASENFSNLFCRPTNPLFLEEGKPSGETNTDLSVKPKLIWNDLWAL